MAREWEVAMKRLLSAGMFVIGMAYAALVMPAVLRR